MEFNITPYHDDFEASNGPRESNYMRILFKPSYAVQARELTQIQTIIQNQIKQFGNHIFKDGSPVHGGHLTLNTATTSIKLDKQFNKADIDLSKFKNQIIIERGSNSNIKSARVLAVDDSQEQPTLMVTYLTDPFADGDEIQSSANSSIVASIVDGNGNQSSGIGSIVSINEGVFYVNGFFVYVAPQTIVLEAYSNVPNYKIGLEIEESIIDVEMDASLGDPAQESFNYQAPGADRYQFNLNLAKRSLDSTDDSSFFELLRVENGTITKQVSYPLYSDIENTLARRTYDQSGSFTVKPFNVGTSDITETPNKFSLDISAGKAYIKGYEFETINTSKIQLDRARTTSDSTDYELSLQYGNYVVVKDLYTGSLSNLDLANLKSVDIHANPVASINTASQQAYSYTKIGSARVKNITYASSDKYYVYLTSINVASLDDITNSGTSAAANIITLPFNVNVTNQYANVDVTVVSGTSAGDTRRIISSTGNTLTVDRNFSEILDDTSVISLNFSIKDAASIVVPPASSGEFGVGSSTFYYPQDVSKYPSMNIDSSSKTIAGNTIVSLSSMDRSIYPLPQPYITHNDFSDISYYKTKLVSGGSFGSGSYSIDLGANETFYYGTSGQQLSAELINQHLLVLLKADCTINGVPYKAGEVLPLADMVAPPFGATVTRSSGDTSLTIFIGDIDSTISTTDIYVDVKVSHSSGSGRSKTLKGVTTDTIDNIVSLTYDSFDTSVTINTVEVAKIYKANGFVLLKDSSVIPKVPGEKKSLFIPDVIKITKIYDSGNTSHSPNTTNAIDITENYLFDNGQTDSLYDHATITLKDTAYPPTGQTAIIVQYFDHSNDTGFFSAASYSESLYTSNKIPVYNSKSGTFSLRDAIDFRPTRPIADTSYSLSGSVTVDPDLPMTLSYKFYLGRIDKLIASQNKEFKIHTGIPSDIPVEPSDSEDGMTLYSIYVPPYTYDIRDIKFKAYDNKRYTMSDIGNIDKRLKQVEYYTSLSLLESKARSQSVLYENAVLQKEKYGIIVDQFDGFNIADNRNSDLVCQISFSSLKPYKKTSAIGLNLVSSSGDYGDNKRTYSIKYTETPAIVQNTATKSVSVQPYTFAQYVGKTILMPETDYWFSSSLTPEVITSPHDIITTSKPPTELNDTPTVGVTQNAVANTALDNIGYGFIQWQDQKETANTEASTADDTRLSSKDFMINMISPDQPFTISLSNGGGALSGGTNLYPIWKNIWFH